MFLGVTIKKLIDWLKVLLGIGKFLSPNNHLTNGVEDWRVEFVKYLKDPSQGVSKKLRYKAIKFVLLDDQLYYKIVDGVLLKCLNQEEAKVVMGEIHEGVCGAHQLAHKMKWMIRRAGYFWPTMLEDCFRYYKGC
jgi:hypothetical protein